MTELTKSISEPVHANATGPPDRSASATPRHLGRLAGNIVANLLRQGTSWLIVLFVPPLLVRTLSKDAYSTWMLVLQMGAYATMFDAGLQMAVSRFVAQAHASRNRTQMGEILSSATVLFLAGGALCLLAVCLAAAFFARMFPSVPAALQPQAARALLFVGGALALAFPSSVLAGLSLGLQRNHLNAIAGSVSKVLGSAGAVWAAIHHQGLAVMAAWVAAGYLAQPLVFAAGTWSQGLPSLLRTRLVRTHRMLEFARFSSAMVVSEVGMLLISGLDLPIVATFDFRNAGYYAIAITLSNLLAVPHGAFLSALVPVFSGISLDASPQRMGDVVLRVTRLGTVLLALVSVPLIVAMPTLLNMWVGAAYARHCLLFGEMLVTAQLLRLSLMPFSLIGFSAGQQSRMLLSPVVESLVNITCSVGLAWHLGAVGVAGGSLIGALVGVAVHFLKSMPAARSTLDFSRTHLLAAGILAPAAWAAGATALLLALLPLLHTPCFRLALIAVGVLLLAGIYWRFTLQAIDRLAFQTLLARVRPSPAALGTGATL